MSDTAMKKGWRTWRFDEMAVIVNDRIDDPAEAGVDRYVGLEHLDPESLMIRRWGSPDEVEATKLRFRAGDIIFGRRRAYQRKLAVADFDGICSAHAMVLRARPQTVVPELLPFFMQSDLFMHRALEISVGSLSPTINWKTLAKERFALPPLEEQQRIAEALHSALSMYEATRDLRYRSLAAHRASLASMQVTSDFERMQLDILLSRIVAGKSLAGVDEAPAEREYGVIKVSAVDPEGFRAQESKRLLDPAGFVPALSVRAGDLLITRANTPELVGEVCLVEGDHANLMLCDKTLRLEPKADADPYLLWETLQAEDVRRQIRAVATGTGRAMKNISQPKIRSLSVTFPVERARNNVRERLLASRTAIRAIQGRLDESVRLMRSLRERLMTWEAS